jgi:hypothetical protein
MLPLAVRVPTISSSPLPAVVSPSPQHTQQSHSHAKLSQSIHKHTQNSSNPRARTRTHAHARARTYESMHTHTATPTANRKMSTAKRHAHITREIRTLACTIEPSGKCSRTGTGPIALARDRACCSRSARVSSWDSAAARFCAARATSAKSSAVNSKNSSGGSEAADADAFLQQG